MPRLNFAQHDYQAGRPVTPESSNYEADILSESLEFPWRISRMIASFLAHGGRAQ
jgi:hypothetical protein